MKNTYITIIAVTLCALAFSGMAFLVKNTLEKEGYFENQDGAISETASKSISEAASKEITEKSPVSEMPVEEASDGKIKGPVVLDKINSDQAENETGEKKENTQDSGNKFKFAIIGDTQRFKAENRDGALQKAVQKIKEQNIDLTFAVGDIVPNCDDKCGEKITDWKTTLGSLSEKTYVTMGNHDRAGKEKSDKIFQDSFSFPTNGPDGYSELAYSFDQKNSHFVILDSAKPEEHLINETQQNWLKKDLAATKKENKFVFFHEPAYPLSDKIDESLDVNKKERDALWDIFKKYNVTAIFNGHEHIQSRRNVDGIWQFVFGNTDSFDHDLPKTGADFSHQGKAFGIIEVDGKNIKVETISVDGFLLNEFSFSK